MTKPQDEEEGNAYATTDDWTLESDDREALSSSIQQHAANLKGEDGGAIILDDDKGDVLPLGNPSERSTRTFNSLSDEGMGRTGSGRNLSYNTSRSRSARAAAVAKPKSALKSSKRYLGAVPYKDDQSISSKAPFSKPTYSTNQQTRSGTKIRALIALACLIVSIVLAILFGHGMTGRWITSLFIDHSSTANKEAPQHGGIPGSIGGTPAYNGTFEIPDLERMNIVLPAAIESGLQDWRIPFPAGNRTDLPMYWQIPKSGGTVVQRILGQCLGLVEVSKEGAGHDEATLQILETSTGTRYINVDTTTQQGLQRARDLKLVQSSLADVMFTPFVLQSAEIFTPPEHRGRFFSIFRPPLERAMGIYQAAKATDPTVASMSLADFASYKLPNNEMVRTLNNKAPDADLTEDDLFLAMEILRRKCVVGLVHRMAESMVRFHGYFGWYSLMVDGVSRCQSSLLVSSTNHAPAPQEGSDAYNIMMNQNRLDLRLYEYAQYLYDVQGGNARTE